MEMVVIVALDKMADFGEQKEIRRKNLHIKVLV